MQARSVFTSILGLVAIGLLLFTAVAAFPQGPPDTQPPSPCACGAQFVCETAIVNALEGERATINLISNLPGPLPTPALSDIASKFRKIGEDLVDLRALRLYATLPVPLPMPRRELIARSLDAVVDVPVPMPYPVREEIAAAAKTVSDLPGPLPTPVMMQIRNTLRHDAATPGLPENTRKLLFLASQLVSALPTAQAGDAGDQEAMARATEQAYDNTVNALKDLNNAIAGTPEAAPLEEQEERVKDSFNDIPAPTPLPCEDCPN